MAEFYDPSDPQYLALQRRRKMAQALAQSGMDSSPTTGLGGLARIVQALVGAYQNKGLDAEEKDFNTQQQGKLASALDSYQRLSAGGPVPQPVKQDDEGNPMPDPGTMPPDPRGARMALINSGIPALQQFGVQSMLTQDKQTPFGKIDPKDYTPESLTAFAQSNDYTKLVPRVKKEGVDTGTGTTFVDPFNPPSNVPKSKRDFIQANGQNVLADINSLPLGTAVNPGLTEKDRRTLAVSEGHLRNDNARTAYETGMGSGGVSAPGASAPAPMGFITGAPPRGLATGNVFTGLAPRDQASLAKQGYETGLSMLQKEGEQAAGLSDAEGLYKRWLDLNKVVNTGPIAGRRAVSFDKNYQELKQLESKLATSDFKPGQGQISNFERQLFKESGPNTTNDSKTNENIVGLRLGAIQNTKDRLNFKQWFLQQNGSLMGADKQWQDYLDANPRFVTDDKRNVVPNANRVDYSTYFTLLSRGAKPLPVDSGTMNVDPKKLRPGTWYITPKGAGKWDGTKFLEEGEG